MQLGELLGSFENNDEQQQDNDETNDDASSAGVFCCPSSNSLQLARRFAKPILGRVYSLVRLLEHSVVLF